jgi:hypothetical protein
MYGVLTLVAGIGSIAWLALLIVISRRYPVRALSMTAIGFVVGFAIAICRSRWSFQGRATTSKGRTMDWEYTRARIDAMVSAERTVGEMVVGVNRRVRSRARRALGKATSQA